MARSSSKFIEYVVDSKLTRVCPECKEDIEFMGPIVDCKCGWAGKGGEVKTKLVEIRIKARKTVTYA